MPKECGIDVEFFILHLTIFFEYVILYVYYGKLYDIYLLC